MQIDNGIQSPVFQNVSKLRGHGDEANLENNKNQSNLQTTNLNNKNEKIENSMIDSSLVYSDEKNLNFVEKLKKLIIENIFSKFQGNEGAVSLFPNSDTTQFNVSQVSANPYEQSLKQSPSGFVYESTQEYYAKTTIDFSTSLSVNTPNGQYDIELNLSFTHEYYERNSTRIAVSNAPMRLDLEEDDDSLKGLKRLDLLFDINKEEDENKTLFEQIRDIIRQREQLMDKINENNDFGHSKALSNQLDNFKLWEKDDKGNFNPLAVGQGGIGIFLANSYSQSTSISASVSNDSASFEYSSSTSSSSFAAIVGEIKA